jgi:hypothetical protein
MKQFTRKPFLTAPAGAVPIARASKGSNVITQAEIQAILDRDKENDRAVLKLRRRLEAGACVERGPLMVELQPGRDPIEDEVCEFAGIALCGVEIGRDPGSYKSIALRDPAVAACLAETGYHFPGRV